MTIYRDDLERVYALIEKPEAWTQKAYARDSRGLRTGAFAKEACSFCIEGAIMRAYKGTATQHYKIYWFLTETLEINLAQFNDTHTHAEVLALLRQAIERAPVRTDRGEA